MNQQSRHDAWSAGDSYEIYMGRWSRQVSARFLDWLNAPAGLDWLDVGCGTGALLQAILDSTEPRSATGIDSSPTFVEAAGQLISDTRAQVRTGDALSLPLEDGQIDLAVSALVLNFIPDRDKALAEMSRVTRNGGTVAFYVWDYPGGGMELMRHFWQAAAELDPAVADLSEATRFPYCTPDGLARLANDAGLQSVECTSIEVPTPFASFDDYWHPFTLGAGPAPGYCANLSESARQQLRDKLRADLPQKPDGSIALTARAWAVRGLVD